MIDSIVEYEELEDANPEYVIVGNATFKEDFGPFKKGETVLSLRLSHVEAALAEFDYDGNIVRTVKVKLVPDE